MERLSAKATRQHLRDHNSRLVLRTVYDHGAISRADLARRTHLTRATVSAVISELIEQGLVEETGSGPASGGRTPILVGVVPDARQLVCVNLTGAELDGAVINMRGAIRTRACLPLAGETGAALLERLELFVSGLLESVTRPLLGVGICTPGLIDADSGVLLRALNLGWHDLPLRDLLQQRYQTPVYLVRDSHAVALAEYMFGPTPASANLIAITLGQGVGAGIVLGDQLFAGENFGAGEIGHVVVDAEGPGCACGNRGCLELFVGAEGVARQARALADAHPESPLGGLLARGSELDAAAVAAAAQAGDPAAAELIETVGRHLGVAVANLIGAFSIRRILITGPGAHFGPLLGASVRAEAARRVLPALAERTAVEVQAHGSEMQLFGAAALLLTHELGLARLSGRAVER
jgi:predicted NBD/HSP70 family sugar kinase